MTGVGRTSAEVLAGPGAPGLEVTPQPERAPDAIHESGSRRRRRRGRHAATGIDRRRLAVGASVALLLVAGAGAALAAFRYVPALDEARGLSSDIEAIVSRAKAAGLAMDRPTLTTLELDVGAARDRYDGLRDFLAGDPLVAVARALPPTRDAIIGADVVTAAGGDVLDAADAGIALAGRYVAVRELQVASASSGAGQGSALAGLVELMATGGGEVDRMVAALDRAQAALTGAPRDLPGPVAHARDLIQVRLDQFGPALRSYAQLDDALPAILGWDGPRRYLVLSQDPAELRATGGFIGSYGFITFDRGRMTERQFQGVETLGGPLDHPFVRPPSALANYLLGGTQSWAFPDANWSPDFPTSARDVVRLYRNAGGTGQIDGVIGITTYTIDELLKVTGPISVPGYDVTIAPGEATLKTLQETRLPNNPGTHRKAFLSALADRLVDSLLALPARRWTDLAARGDTFRSGHLVLAWFNDPLAQAAVTRMGIDGAIRTDPGDYVYPVDSNVSPVSKLNVVTDRTIELDVRLDEYGNALDTLAVRWTNRIEEPAARPFRELHGLEDLTTLGMYFRVYVPERSRVEMVSAGTTIPLTSLSDVGDEAGRMVMASYFRIPPGSASLTYSWTSPYAAELGEDGIATYRLTIQKQPGVPPGPLSLRITVPQGATVLEASPGLTRVGNTLAVETTFDRDVVVVVRYRPAAETP